MLQCDIRCFLSFFQKQLNSIDDSDGEMHRTTSAVLLDLFKKYLLDHSLSAVVETSTRVQTLFETIYKETLTLTQPTLVRCLGKSDYTIYLNVFCIGSISISNYL